MSDGMPVKTTEQILINDLNHRARVRQDAELSLEKKLGIDCSTAELIVKAIDDGLIEHVILKY